MHVIFTPCKPEVIIFPPYVHVAVRLPLNINLVAIVLVAKTIFCSEEVIAV